MKRALALAGLAGALALPACGGGLGSALGLPSIPNPTASPAPLISTVPASLALSVSAAGGLAATQTMTVSETGGYGSTYFTVTSSDVTTATVAQSTASTNAYLVTAIKAGKTKVHVTDSSGTATDIPVTVSP